MGSGKGTGSRVKDALILLTAHSVGSASNGEGARLAVGGHTV